MLTVRVEVIPSAVGSADITALVNSRPAVHSLNVSIGGSALRVRKDDFEREILKSEGLLQSLLGYAAEYVTQISQRSACGCHSKASNWRLGPKKWTRPLSS